MPPTNIAWLARHPRVTFHLTPTSASWLNAVEGFFAVLTKRRLKRGTFVGIVDLQAAIHRYVADHNDRRPTPIKSLPLQPEGTRRWIQAKPRECRNYCVNAGYASVKL
jgi:transposase